jgi:hypothetical protein
MTMHELLFGKVHTLCLPCHASATSPGFHAVLEAQKHWEAGRSQHFVASGPLEFMCKKDSGAALNCF